MMINNSIASALISSAIPGAAHTPDFTPKIKKSRGKGGKFSCKPSGAAALKRAAKKRNNIRKHR